MFILASASKIGLALFISGAISLACHYTSFLMALLHLEICNVGTYFVLLSSITSTVSPAQLTLLLCMIVCEAATGLGALVMMARTHGSDYMATVGTLTF